MNKETTEKDIQRILNRLISEEWIASEMYKGFVLAAEQECRPRIRKLMHEIAEDEIDDHYKKLVNFADRNGFDIPCTVKEYQKYASEAVTKQFNSFKKGKNCEYYASEGVKAEEEAIKSYVEIMEKYDVCEELNSILLSNYYDEVEHLQKFKTLILALGADMYMPY